MFQQIEVSLFTREWIEIFSDCHNNYLLKSLPLYEGVDWNSQCSVEFVAICICLPLYEGVDWNLQQLHTTAIHSASPSLRGSGLKFYYNAFYSICKLVSLFTREWIEIFGWYIYYTTNVVSPSLRGSGLKCMISQNECTLTKSPSLRGSGLKFRPRSIQLRHIRSPSLRGSGLKLKM